MVKEENKMKIKLNKFIPKKDKSDFSSALLSSSYEEVVRKFKNKYIHVFTTTRFDKLNIKLEDFLSLKQFAIELIKNVKQYVSTNEKDIISFFLDKLQPNMQALFYLKNATSSLDYLLNFCEILDHERANREENQSVNVARTSNQNDNDSIITEQNTSYAGTSKRRRDSSSESDNSYSRSIKSRKTVN